MSPRANNSLLQMLQQTLPPSLNVQYFRSSSVPISKTTAVLVPTGKWQDVAILLWRT